MCGKDELFSSRYSGGDNRIPSPLLLLGGKGGLGWGWDAVLFDTIDSLKKREEIRSIPTCLNTIPTPDTLNSFISRVSNKTRGSITESI
jgi:hypothetical protein